MNTDVYSWTIPPRGADPWHPHMDRLFSQIDTTVNSVRTWSRVGMTVAVSAWCTQSLYTVVGTYSLASAETWVPLSFAPQGACAGSFFVVRSGSEPVIECAVQFYAGVRVDIRPDSVITPKFYFRAVVNPGSVSFNTDCRWLLRAHEGRTMRFYGTAVTSLAPGAHSIEIQVRMQTFSDAAQQPDARTASGFSIFPSYHTHVTITEAAPVP